MTHILWARKRPSKWTSDFSYKKVTFSIQFSLTPFQSTAPGHFDMLDLQDRRRFDDPVLRLPEMLDLPKRQEMA